MTQPGMFDQLGSWIDQLARRWDRFLSGDPKVPIPPERERAALERRLRDLSRGEPRSAADQFRLEQLLHRFATYNNLWQRQLRDREIAATQERDRAANVGDASSVARGDEGLVGLHTRYVELLQASGRPASVSLERFRATIEAERQRLSEEGAEIDGFEVIEDGGKVRVRARLRRRRQG